jgi:hypothetical protein
VFDAAELAPLLANRAVLLFDRDRDHQQHAMHINARRHFLLRMK